MGWIHQNYEIVTVVLAVIGVGLAWFQLRKREPATTKVERSRVDHSAIVSGSNNQVIIGHSPSGPATTEPIKIERAAPNLVYAGARRKNIFVSPWSREGFCDPRTEEQRTKSISAFVLKFENRIMAGNRKIARALNVIAKLSFHHKNGATKRDIDYGVWLNSPCNSTDIGIGDTCELVLICELENNLVTFEDRRRGNDNFDEGFSYVQDGDVNGYERVDVTLIDQTTQASLTVKLKVWRDGSNFCTSEV